MSAKNKQPLLERKVSVWFLLVLTFLVCFFIVAFGWSVRTTTLGNDRSGLFGRIAVEVAAFPTTTKQVFRDLRDYATGAYRERAAIVEGARQGLGPGFRPVPAAPEIDLAGLMMRADPAAVTPGWRALSGIFAIDGDMKNAILLMSPDLRVVKAWTLDEDPDGADGLRPQAPHLKIVHGFEVLPDGSVVFVFDGGVPIQRFDACGRRLWSTGGSHFSHAVTLDDSGAAVWTLTSHHSVDLVSVADGRVLRRIEMEEIVAANPMIGLLEIRRSYGDHVNSNRPNTTGPWLADRFHLNDVEALPPALADRFAGFEAGDLLISARSLNLIFVMDPETLRIKWWRVGATHRQHDPDWLPDGTIMVFNNRMSRDFSEIVALDPATYARRTLVDGRAMGFFSRIRGKAQRLDDGTVVVSSAQQGRAFEMAPSGDIVLEIFNIKPGSDTASYALTELRWLPPDHFDPRSLECPPTN